MDAQKIRQDFPILGIRHNGKRIAYLDNAATTQKPRSVINAVKEYYENYNANVHRGLNFLSQKATDKYEEAHEKTARLINAKSPGEIVFTKNATESLNLLAYSLEGKVSEGDEILLTKMEHHANLVPWQELAKRKKAKLVFAGITREGKLDLEDFALKIGNRTKIVSVTQASNILGTINPVKRLAKEAKKNGAIFIIDAAQSAPHIKIDARGIGADFMAFSAHKMLGPTGIGVLWGKEEMLGEMPPFLTGGDMISEVTFEKSTWNKLPWKFEAGTPNIAGAIGFGAAIDYLKKTGFAGIRAQEQRLLKYGLRRLSEINGVKLYGPKAGERTGIIAFNLNNVHPHDVAGILDENAVAIRSGNHCAQPLMNEMGIQGVARASFYIYNTPEEIDRLVDGIIRAKKVFGV